MCREHLGKVDLERAGGHPLDMIARFQKVLGGAFNGIWHGHARKLPRAKGKPNSDPHLSHVQT
eukprot:2241906-Pyramimonas_sp.AAC.1